MVKHCWLRLRSHRFKSIMVGNRTQYADYPYEHVEMWQRVCQSCNYRTS